MHRNFNAKKIALFAPNLAGGGAERIISILATHFSELGFQVDLLLAKSSGPYLKCISVDVNVIDLNCEKVSFSLPKLVCYLRSNKPEILFSSQFHTNTIALWAVKISGAETKVVIRQPTMLRPAFEKKSFSSRLRQKLLLWSAKKWAYKVVVTSQVMGDEFAALSKISFDKISIIYNPLPVDQIKEKSEELLQHTWFQKGQPPVVLAVGRLVHVKDFQSLVKAFAIVKEKTDARLMILGEGPLRADLEKLIESLNISPYVEMPGFVENPFQYMKLSKVFVMSSLWEGFPNSMIEAMACGTNVVATNCEGGTAEILEHGIWGELVTVQDHEEMAKAITYSLNKNNYLSFKAVERFEVNGILHRFASLMS